MAGEDLLLADSGERRPDPSDRLAKARAGVGLLRKKFGLRYAMNVVPLDARWVKGSHGRLPDDPADAPELALIEGAFA